MSPIMTALKQFEAAEANLLKVERLWKELQALFPQGLNIGDNPEYEDRSRSFDILLASLPMIDGWKPSLSPPDPTSVLANRFDFMELGEPLAEAHFEQSVWEDGRQIREYRFRLSQRRRALIRDALVEAIDTIDVDLRSLHEQTADLQLVDKIDDYRWAQIRQHADQIEVLLGSSVEKPPRWTDFRRHLWFGHAADLRDIENNDWPLIKAGLRKGLYGANEPVPIEVNDLSDLVAAKPRGPITTKLQWSNLSDDGFERLLFALISSEPGYENLEWLMKTRAPDRGRDLNVTRVIVDTLAGTSRHRVIVQCKHWQANSISLVEAAAAKEQTTLWSDPRVDVLVLATSGRFTADAVQWVERHNATGALPKIEMWPESHLERALAARPAFIAEFGLR